MFLQSIDLSIVKSLNRWAGKNLDVVTFLSNQLVYVVLIIGVFWVLTHAYRGITEFNLLKFVKRGIHDGLFLLAIPVGAATLLSEVTSMIFPRPRPFAAHANIVLITPHAADGGMPSHHVVFMISIAACLFFYSRSLAWMVGALTIISGIARVAAGIHYPTDIMCGLVIGIGAVLVSRYILNELRKKFGPRIKARSVDERQQPVRWHGRGLF